jgi:uncharacterized protein (TIGR00369 family)
MDIAELTAFLHREFPQAAQDHTIVDLGADRLDLRLAVGTRHLRPGGTVSGPAIFGLADVAVYLALMAMIGPQALADTTGANIDFLRKPPAGHDLLARARLIKRGRVLVVGDVLVTPVEAEVPLARASMTYSVPPAR